VNKIREKEHKAPLHEDQVKDRTKDHARTGAEATEAVAGVIAGAV